jgi:hypothetical protein
MRRFPGYHIIVTGVYGRIHQEEFKEMKQRLFLAAVGASAIGLLAGCAKTTPVEGAPSPNATVAAGGTARWTANLASVTQNTGAVQQSTRDRSYGTATWTVGASNTLSNINLVFTYTGQEKTLAWAIVPGTCGNPALPVLPMSNFPELNVGGGGRAQVTTSMPIALPASGAYHIDIYRDRRGGADALIACGNLRYAS